MGARVGTRGERRRARQGRRRHSAPGRSAGGTELPSCAHRARGVGASVRATAWQVPRQAGAQSCAQCCHPAHCRAAQAVRHQSSHLPGSPGPPAPVAGCASPSRNASPSIHFPRGPRPHTATIMPHHIATTHHHASSAAPPLQPPTLSTWSRLTSSWLSRTSTTSALFCSAAQISGVMPSCRPMAFRVLKCRGGMAGGGGAARGGCKGGLQGPAPWLPGRAPVQGSCPGEWSANVGGGGGSAHPVRRRGAAQGHRVCALRAPVPCGSRSPGLTHIEGITHRVLLVHVCAVRQQQLHHLRVPLLGGVLQRRAAPLQGGRGG